MKKNRPEVIAFDVIETLFSLAPIADLFTSVGLQRESLPGFFSKMLKDAFALEISRGTSRSGRLPLLRFKS
jgi:2-haloacid dehalogenase